MGSSSIKKSSEMCVAYVVQKCGKECAYLRHVIVPESFTAVEVPYFLVSYHKLTPMTDYN